MTAELLRWCRKQALFPAGGPVLAALSGGADSVALLHCLLALQDQLNIQVVAAHFNHRLRGAESDADEAFCRRLCADWGVRLHVGSADVSGFAAGRGLGVEEAARLLRYAFLTETARGATIATAHNADDNLETMLMHLLRGCGLRGLGGIPPVRSGIVRPLLWASRREIEGYLTRQGLPHREDSTNAQDICLRNRLRHGALPLLRQEAGDLTARAFETAQSLREDEAYLSQCAAALLGAAQAGPDWLVGPLRDAPRPLRLRALSQLLRGAGGHDLTCAHLESAESLILSAHPSAQMQAPGVLLRREYDHLCVGNPPALPIPVQPVPQQGSVVLPDGRLLTCDVGLCPAVLDYPNEFALDPERTENLLVRSRRSGDRLRTAGGSKLLKARMIDCKIPAASRDCVPVLECAGQVIAAFGVGADPAYRAMPPKPALLLRLTQP